MARTGKDLTGQRFGKLTVTGFAGYERNSRQRYSLWDCRCDCGNTCQASGTALQRGMHKSCGCMHASISYLIGKKYGKLTILGEDPNNHTTLRKVICRCDCGQEKIVSVRDLKNGRVTNCGCEKRQKQKQNFQSRFYTEELEEKRRAFQNGDQSKIYTLNDWVYIWITVVLPNVIKESTIYMYAEIMENHILPPLGKMKLTEITEEEVGNWIHGLQKIMVYGTKTGRMTEGTVRNILSVLSGCMRDAQKWGLILKNPCPGAAWVLKEKNVHENQAWLSEEQVGELEPLLAAYEDEDGYPIGLGFQLVLYTGVTLSEAAALRWQDVDYENKDLHIKSFIAVRRHMENGKSEYEIENLTGKKQRNVPVPDFMLERLGQIQKAFQAEAGDFVLCRSDRQPIQIDRMRAALLRRGYSCGMGTVTPRMLRDTYAIRAVQAGATSDMIAELMGFASPQHVIRRYMPAAVIDKRELVDKMFGK